MDKHRPEKTVTRKCKITLEPWSWMWGSLWLVAYAFVGQVSTNVSHLGIWVRIVFPQDSARASKGTAPWSLGGLQKAMVWEGLYHDTAGTTNGWIDWSRISAISTPFCTIPHKSSHIPLYFIVWPSGAWKLPSLPRRSCVLSWARCQTQRLVWLHLFEQASWKGSPCRIQPLNEQAVVVQHKRRFWGLEKFVPKRWFVTWNGKKRQHKKLWLHFVHTSGCKRDYDDSNYVWMAIYKQAPPLHDLPLHCMKNTKIYFALFAMNSPMKTTQQD